MSFPILEHIAKSARHATFYLSCGAEQATPIIFLHGWPELSISWRGQLPVFAGLGFRAVAPDMRGYGRSSVHPRHEDYALEEIVADMLELLASLGAEKAIWVGHDWGAPVVWSIAQHHPERCHGVANLCVPYIPNGFAVETVVPLADRSVYPVDKFPVAQWDYQMFYRENFAVAEAGFETNVGATVRALFRAGNPAGKGKPARTAFVSANGGYFRAAQFGRARPSARRRRARRGRRASLCRGAQTQRVLRPRQLVHELEGQYRLCRAGERHLAAQYAGALPACGLRLYLRNPRLAPRRADARPLREPDRSYDSFRPLDGAGEAS